jgi:signal transduction histidine kinase
MIKETVVTHGIQVTTALQDLPETLRVDERKLKQVLYNLLSNAAKFTPKGGSISLAARCIALEDDFLITRDGRKIEIPFENGSEGRASAEFIEIIVQDSGIGLHEKDLNRIFEPFTQVESSPTRKYQGTGLGLSLSKNLVELHRGRIWAESEGIDKGAVFCILLPACIG